MKTAHGRGDIRRKAEELAAQLATLPDRGEDILRWLVHQKAHEQWASAKAAHERWQAGVPRAQRQLQRGAWIENAIPPTDRLIEAAQTFQAEHRAWEAAVRNYAEVVGTLDQLQAELKEWRGAEAALAAIRTRVKTHLAPSLSRAASSLLSRMTAGALSTMEVSEDFDVRVDGKAVEGLSGAGKAAANLALRIALGYVLTNRVFSVLLADEVDAGMDAERADATAQAFQNLTATLKQVLLVTHKTPEGDHYIRLDCSSARRPLDT